MQIRELATGDLSGVANLFLTVFRNVPSARSRELERYFESIYLNHPWRQPGMESLVAVAADGTVEAFIGVLPVRMIWRDSLATASVATCLMVRPNSSFRMAGAQILRAYFRRDSWLAFSENAAGVTEAMWKQLRGQVLAPESLGFRLVLRPAEFSIGEARKRLPRAISSVLQLTLPLLRPLMQRDRLKSILSDPKHWSVREASDDDLVETIPRLQRNMELRPAWDPGAIRWFMEKARERKGGGRLRSIIISTRGGHIAGAALYFIDDAGRAEVLDTFYEDELLEWVLDGLISDAHAQGSCRLEGCVRRPYIIPLGHRGATFRVGSATVVNSSDRDIKGLLLSGVVPLGGIAGEGWSRLLNDTFVLDPA